MKSFQSIETMLGTKLYLCVKTKKNKIKNNIERKKYYIQDFSKVLGVMPFNLLIIKFWRVFLILSKEKLIFESITETVFRQN